jgi:hypothetical protein
MLAGAAIVVLCCISDAVAWSLLHACLMDPPLHVLLNLYGRCNDTRHELPQPAPCRLCTSVLLL